VSNDIKKEMDYNKSEKNLTFFKKKKKFKKNKSIYIIRGYFLKALFKETTSSIKYKKRSE
jgi:hypothetical protein